jgi:hypothetical protein
MFSFFILFLLFQSPKKKGKEKKKKERTKQQWKINFICFQCELSTPPTLVI